MNFNFTNEYAVSKLDEIVTYLLGPRLWMPQTDYPDFLDWAQKTHKELKAEAKRAMLAIENKEIIGVTIYQRHKNFQDFLEIKNLTVRPNKRGRYVASFLLRNSEIEGSTEFGVNHVICDAKARNHLIHFFLSNNGYRISGKTDLYGKNSGDDLIYKKYVPIFNRKIR